MTTTENIYHYPASLQVIIGLKPIAFKIPLQGHGLSHHFVIGKLSQKTMGDGTQLEEILELIEESNEIRIQIGSLFEELEDPIVVTKLHSIKKDLGEIELTFKFSQLSPSVSAILNEMNLDQGN